MRGVNVGRGVRVGVAVALFNAIKLVASHANAVTSVATARIKIFRFTGLLLWTGNIILAIE
jgi:hypothetical protein